MRWDAKLVGLASGLFLAVSTLGAGKTETRLVLSADTAQPGETVLAGVHLRMAPRWHTYWQNAGDSGAPTKIDWTLPEGVTAGEILWPVPEKYQSGDLITYVYHNEVVLLIPLSLAGSLKAGPMAISAQVSWLECEELCVPGKATLSATLRVGAQSKPSNDASLIQTWQRKLPLAKPDSDARAWWDSAASGDTRAFLLEWTKGSDTMNGDFFPFSAETYAVKPATQTREAPAGKIRIRQEVEKLEGNWPEQLAGLLIERGEGGKLAAAYEVKVPLATSSGPESSVAGSVPSPAAETPEGGSLFGWLMGAFLGGLILNLMPCVLPVIALKILGFVNQSRESPQQVRKLGLIYALGVLVSFAGLAGFVIGVQKAGRLASWGMQFGNPQFLVAMTILVTLVALNLFGLFEVTLGGGAMNAAGELASRHGASGAFFNGVLATALATPCTAPFLAGALGFAFAQPPSIILLFFLTAGLGLAAPYVVLSWQPGWLRFIPKPGVWMEKFKIAMGFPMLATALWLLSLVSRHFGKSGLLWMGLFLITLAMAAWIWGEFVQRGTRRRGLALVVSVALLTAGYVYALEKQLHWRSPAKVTAETPTNHSGGIPWQPWSKTAVDKARAEGRPVLVDFTADWCVTCQANKKTSLEVSSVQAKLEQTKAVPLLADYTLVPDDITEELRRFNRAGVPLVLVYPRDANQPPIVLPTVLTPGIVLDALDRAAK